MVGGNNGGGGNLGPSSPAGRRSLGPAGAGRGPRADAGTAGPKYHALFPQQPSVVALQTRITLFPGGNAFDMNIAALASGKETLQLAPPLGHTVFAAVVLVGGAGGEAGALPANPPIRWTAASDWGIRRGLLGGHGPNIVPGLQAGNKSGEPQNA